MDYKELSKDNGIGYTYWFENLKNLFQDYQLELPDTQALAIEYHQGKSVWEVFISKRKNQSITSL